jgi:hypothetical protein
VIKKTSQIVIDISTIACILFAICFVVGVGVGLFVVAHFVIETNFQNYQIYESLLLMECSFDYKVYYSSCSFKCVLLCTVTPTTYKPADKKKIVQNPPFQGM